MEAFKGRIHIGVTLMGLYAMNPTLDQAYIHWGFVGGAVVGSVLPDCDIKFSPAAIIPAWLFLKHRHQTHSILAVGIFTAAGFLVSPNFAMGIALGTLSHLFFDNLTPMGLPFLWWNPFNKNWNKNKKLS